MAISWATSEFGYSTLQPNQELVSHKALYAGKRRVCIASYIHVVARGKFVLPDVSSAVRDQGLR